MRTGASIFIVLAAAYRVHIAAAAGRSCAGLLDNVSQKRV